MNSYLALKCRSEQQVMNELAKSIASKDFTKKTVPLLHELTIFYVSINTDTDGSSAHIHDSVLKDLTTLLMHIKDKKEDQRIVKIVMILLQRIAEQMIYSQAVKNAPTLSVQPPTSPRGDKTEVVVQALTNLADFVAKAEVTHAFPPRRVSAFKLFFMLSHAIQQPERPLSLTSNIQSSSAWTMLKLAASKKKGADKELPTQLAILNGSFQIARHATSLESFESLLPQLVQGAFLPNRHAAAICLRLFDVVPLKVVDALYAHVSGTTLSLNTSDALSTVYLIRLCGNIARLPVSKKQSNASSAQTLLDFSFDSAKPVKREEKAATGPAIDAAVSTRITDLLMDLCMQKHTFALAAAPSSPTHASPFTSTTLSPCTVLLTAIQEMALCQIAPKCFEKVRSGLSPFEIAANGMQLVVQTHAENPLVLQRVARAIQVVAEALDLCLVEYTSGGGHVDFLGKIADSMWELSTSHHFQPCLIKESLTALVWLLPRTNANHQRTSSLSPKSQSHTTAWNRFLTQLRELTTVPELDRGDIVVAMLRRATLFELDVQLLHRSIGILLHWYRQHPCQWHGDVALKLWTTLFNSEIRSLDVFSSVLAVLDHHVPPSKPVQAQAVLYMKCLTLRFVALTLSKVLAQPTTTSPCLDMLSRLTKAALLDEAIVRRLGVQAMMAIAEASSHGGNNEMQHQVSQVLAVVAKQTTSDAFIVQHRSMVF
ncbi:hypothetical protein AC1031_000232 [Aphanomyces cochlioides]|nr:hypothetical protein AC1031_000232 [Aphanomyces cochlioides]